MPSWCGAQLKHRDNFTFTFTFTFKVVIINKNFIISIHFVLKSRRPRTGALLAKSKFKGDINIENSITP
jgi:hypothetical protein